MTKLILKTSPEIPKVTPQIERENVNIESQIIPLEKIPRKKKGPQVISTLEKNTFITWAMDAKSKNPQLGRLFIKGKFQDAYIRGFIDLWNEFVESAEKE